MSFTLGIVSYFNLAQELSAKYIIAVFAGGFALLYFKRDNLYLRLLAILILAFIAGVLVTKYRIIRQNTPVLKKEIVCTIIGIIDSIKPTTRGAQVTISNI